VAGIEPGCNKLPNSHARAPNRGTATNTAYILLKAARLRWWQKGRRAAALASAVATLWDDVASCAAPASTEHPWMSTACAEAGGSELTTRACGGGPSRDCGSSQQHGYGKRAWVGSETDVKEPMAERGERPGQGTAVVELEPELGRAKAGAARAEERGRSE
jgi:hypothetical protein